MAKSKEKLFIEAMKKKFEEDPTEVNTHYYTFGGWKQSKRKREWVEQANQIAKKRGIPMMNQDIGVPLGQRVLMPYRLSHTDIYAEADDLHFMNNAAMQQAWDDIRRTVIVGLDTAHSVIEKRLGKEVTPETINLYLETVNHAMPGGAVVQEHMAEVSPALAEDCYVKVFSGDDELISQIDKCFVIDINKEFPKDQAKQLKDAIGKSVYQVVRAPTLVGRVCDGGTISRWSAMQISMSFISAYRLAAGEAAIADFAYAAKHASVVNMGTMMPARRARGPNEPGGIPFGFLADMVQSTRTNPDDPARAALETVALGAVIYDQIYLGSYMSGGVGFTQYATAAYTDDILEDYVYWALDLIKTKYGGLCNSKPSMDLMEKLGTEVNSYALEMYERYPAAMEAHFGGSQRATVAAAATGIACAMATGNADFGVNGWYLSMLQHKERHGRLGFYGYDLQDQCGSANSFSYRSDEGLAFEMRGPNYPNYAMNVGHLSGYAGIAMAPHAARGDAFACNPLIKVAFADKSLPFDFANITKEFGRGALREFMPAGERTIIIPAK
ncbi:MAG TPA: coenzyme-B sulfoethylthiotransferase subunit alpha [Methanomassiliicoccaceae archaeon]|nr:coenzyme-B sulfoethylthiotransferase subunit alpha [Methanomassiliicoccaceae archaeon]